MRNVVSAVIENLPIHRTRRAYQALSETAAGRIVLADLLAFTGPDRDPFITGDPYQTVYEVGKQRVGRRIQGFLEMTDAEMEHLIQEEAHNGQQTETGAT